MRIFLTGATGYIGNAVLDALVRGGHDVTALVRNNEKARGVAKRGAHPVIGTLEEPESFRIGADAPAKRFVIYTSGVWILGRTPQPVAEDAPINPIAASSFRPAHEQIVLD